MNATYTITNETRGYLAQYVDDLIDVAAQGNAPSSYTVVRDIEEILEDQFYEPAARNDDGRVVDKDELLQLLEDARAKVTPETHCTGCGNLMPEEFFDGAFDGVLNNKLQPFHHGCEDF